MSDNKIFSFDLREEHTESESVTTIELEIFVLEDAVLSDRLKALGYRFKRNGILLGIRVPRPDVFDNRGQESLQMVTIRGCMRTGVMN